MLMSCGKIHPFGDDSLAIFNRKKKMHQNQIKVNVKAVS